MSNSSLVVALASLTTFVAACGAPSETRTPTATPEPDAKPAEASDTERREFMAQCARNEDQKPFCSCSFDQAKTVLTPEELGKSELPPARAAALRRAISTNCTDKLPEHAVKEGFMARCTAQGPSLQGFCDCTWEALRGVMTVKEMAQVGRKDPRVNESAKACVPKFPEKELERSFLEGCVKDPSVDKYCRCAWATLRREVTVADLALGGIPEEESRDAYTKVKSECRKLAPKQPGAAQ